MTTTEMPPLPLTLIVAATLNNGIGIKSGLPWRLSKEMAYFAKVTKGANGGEGNTVIMGRKTWEGIPAKFRPLEGRKNIVVSRDSGYSLGEAKDTHLINSLDSLPSLLSSLSSPPSSSAKTFLIGGSQLYTLSLSSSSPSSPFYYANRILLTRILSSYDCDAFFPELKESEGWKKATHGELEDYVGFKVDEGEVEEVDRMKKVKEGEEKVLVKYRFEMWVR